MTRVLLVWLVLVLSQTVQAQAPGGAASHRTLAPETASLFLPTAREGSAPIAVATLAQRRGEPLRVEILDSMPGDAQMCFSAFTPTERGSRGCVTVAELRHRVLGATP